MNVKKHAYSKLLPIFLLTSSALSAQQIDQAYNQKIKDYTTDTRFLPVSVLNVPNDPKVPSPLNYFGEIIGAPKVLHHTKDIYAYYQKLASSTPAVSMKQVGTSEEGRPIQLVVVGSPEALKKLDHYKNQLALLADPRKVGTMDVNKIIKDSKPIYYLNGGLHSPEMGSPEMLMELTYRLATSQEESIKTIRDNVIVVINPVSEPDGWDKQVDWYYRYTKDREEYGDGFPRVPYWGKYTYHDNNRDGIQISQEVSKAVYKIYYDFHPTVMLDLHESVPLLYISMGTGPYGESADPITIGEWQMFASNEVTALTAQGLPGVFTWAFYDGTNPGYQFWVANNHNSIGRFYETFGNGGASTYIRDLGDQKYAGDPATGREWYRPMAVTEKVNWSFRNNINYMEAGVLASLSFTAANGPTLLKNFYQKGVNAIKRGKEEALKAFVIPKKQRDPGMVAFLVNQLRKQAIEVHTTNDNYVVMLDQPYRNLAISLLTKQKYTDFKYPSYDDVAWTMGYLYGVDVKPIEKLTFSPSDLKLLQSDAVYTGETLGTGSTYVLNYKAQSSVISALYWLKSQNVSMKLLDEKAVVGMDTLEAGSVVFSGLSADQAKQLTGKYGLDLTKTSSTPGVKQHDVTLPKVAIYHSWFNTQDEGWARYAFDQQGIPYTSISKDALKAGGLRQKFDVILIPRMGGSTSDFIHEIDKKFGPVPFTKTAEYPSHGTPDATDDMTGGPGFEGIQQLSLFVEQGGVLITLDNSSNSIAGTGITRDLDPVQTGALYHPGSIVTVKKRKATTPVLYGFPDTFPIFKGSGPLLQTKKYNRDMMLLQYGTKPLKDEIEYKGPIMGLPDAKIEPEKKTMSKDEPYLVSGFVRNEQAIIGHGTVFNVPVGQGHIVAFTFDPLHRYQNLHDASMVWNTLINWNYLK
ncbi:MAG: M14 family zinc carboxypeptidase [Siphonobacter sp.]